ncbi:hypothetical protein HHK36_030306 [Tetracentron sinense]|uniref:ER membrane protein complex subunit 3 n=1 Tax=Tetracentron sinense TaxID=13715 RepID=A0A834YC90_TETSI|nr:hypothetical protein HHK36_030306 [Tetracentron sinense]
MIYFFYVPWQENGLLHVPKGQAQNPKAQMFSDPNMAVDMMKKNLSMIIPQTLTFAWVNFFFSSFVAAKIPFPLTQRFRSMLQNGIDLSSVDVSYVSSRSSYFLNLFGLRGLFSLILGEENATDDTQRMMQTSGFGLIQQSLRSSSKTLRIMNPSNPIICLYALDNFILSFTFYPSITFYTWDPLYTSFHDDEWGVPIHDDRKLFELLVLSEALAELSWPTILNKRDLFRKLFVNFDAVVENNSTGVRFLQQLLLEFHNKPTRNVFRYAHQVPIKTPKIFEALDFAQEELAPKCEERVDSLIAEHESVNATAATDAFKSPRDFLFVYYCFHVLVISMGSQFHCFVYLPLK